MHPSVAGTTSSTSCPPTSARHMARYRRPLCHDEKVLTSSVFGLQVVFGNRTTLQINDIFLSYGANVLAPVIAKFDQVCGGHVFPQPRLHSCI